MELGVLLEQALCRIADDTWITQFMLRFARDLEELPDRPEATSKQGDQQPTRHNTRSTRAASMMLTPHGPRLLLSRMNRSGEKRGAQSTHGPTAAHRAPPAPDSISAFPFLQCGSWMRKGTRLA